MYKKIKIRKKKKKIKAMIKELFHFVEMSLPKAAFAPQTTSTSGRDTVKQQPGFFSRSEGVLV